MARKATTSDTGAGASASEEPVGEPERSAMSDVELPTEPAAEDSATQGAPADAATPAPAELDDPARFVAGFERMVLIREFEAEMHRLFLKGEVHGTTHLSAGQEAVPVGVCLTLEPTDYVAGTYRGHGHALAKGTEAEPLAAEMLGRATGVCGGRAGSMNVIDLEHGLVGCFGIVGGSIAAATGAALTAQRNGGVAAAFFGDGATNQGYFHECLNFAQVLSLPVVFVCENNLYGEFTPMHQVTGGADIAARGAAYGVPARVVDGNDLLAVEEAAREAVERARSGSGPTLLECHTYRHYGHSKSDPATYRPEGELERWLERDPLVVTRARLTGAGVSDEELDAAAARAKETMARASEAALAAPYPDPEREATGEFAP